MKNLHGRGALALEGRARNGGGAGTHALGGARTLLKEARTLLGGQVRCWAGHTCCVERCARCGWGRARCGEAACAWGFNP